MGHLFFSLILSFWGMGYSRGNEGKENPGLGTGAYNLSSYSRFIPNKLRMDEMIIHFNLILDGSCHSV